MRDGRVDFLIAGVQKGGTTALHAYLAEHPGLNLAAEKEVHFFDDETVDWRAPDYGAYHARFDPAAGRITGESTPIYVYWPESLERARRYNPALRLVLLFRDPVARAWSHWKMESGRGLETEPFARCIREGRRRVAESADPPGHHRVFSYVERGFYAAQLERVFRLFAREQVLLLRSDDLRDAPAATLARVCAFLGVDPAGIDPSPRRVFVGEDAGEPAPDDVEHLRALYADDQREFERVAGFTLRQAAV